ncbi:MAG: T9SS type A sorting domain-containing protein [Sphingobacteriales bacterium JAD_PAG50586_3]|nr:MAG: T9SS type A sorting domain-containing protein [Sphingobacteriales bacterium JAD_PAG50586_3]
MKTKFFTFAAAALFGLFLTTDANAQFSGSANGIVVPTKQFSIKVYPNPAVDDLNIEINMPKQLTDIVYIEIMTPQGQKVYQYSCSDCVDKTVHTVNIKDYAAGMYHARVSYLNTVRTTKFLKID